jgi:hypothetical protein
MNEHTDSRNRATVLSVRAMSFTLGGSLGLVSLGLVARATGIPTAWAIAAAIHALVAAGVIVGARALARSSLRSQAPAVAIAPGSPRSGVSDGGAAA